MVEASIDEASADKIQQVLLDIQQLFFQLTKFKNGPDAGKIDLVQFEQGKITSFKKIQYSNAVDSSS